MGLRQLSFFFDLLLLSVGYDLFSEISLYLACLRAFSCCWSAGEALADSGVLGPDLPSERSEPATANFELL